MIESEREQKLLDRLESLGITYTRIEHPAVYTVEQARSYWSDLAGSHCKNLFLRNKKGNRHYLVILEDSKSADLKALIRLLGEDRLSFASPQRIERLLGLEVRVIIDQDLKGSTMIYFHPNVNTATVGLSFADFERFLQDCGQDVRYFQA